MTSRPWLKTFPSLQERDFRVLWAGMLPGILAIQMNFFTNGYLAFELTGKAASIGLISLGFGIPMLCFSLPAGVIADRYSKRMILLASQGVTTAAALLMAVLVISGALGIWQMAAISFLQGTAFSFQMPARQSFIAELVSPKYLLNAIALNSAGFNACRVIGPPLAGWLIGISWINAGGVYLLMAAMYVLVIPSILRIPDRAQRKEPGAKGWQSFVQGISYIRGNQVLLVLLVLSIAPIILGMPFQALMPVFAKNIFAVGPAGLGMLMMANGAGAIAGSLAIASSGSLKRPGMVQLALGALLGVTLAIFAFSGSFYLALPMLFVIGIASSGYLSLNATLIMGRSERQYHGRVMSVYMLTFSALPLGNMLMSLLTDAFGVQAAVGSGGLLLALAVIIFGLSSRAYRGI
ncbi:MAG: MFS transporter [Syntrophales bacterium]|jgi:MFS family permease|nr:MFS transporter [Syntrophales bacterium]